MLKFHELTVSKVIPETEQAVRLVFEIPAELQEAYTFTQGQHLNLEVQVEGETLRRSYSLCNAVGEQGRLEVAVKRQPHGRVSNYINDRVRPGQRMNVMTPGGHFNTPLEPGARRRYAAFAAGSGITPLMSIIRSTLEVEPQSEFTLFYGNRDSASVMFRDALSDLKDRYPTRFRLFHILSREPGDVDLYNGRLDGAKAADLCAAFAPAQDVDHWFVCGPASMIDEVTACLHARGVAGEQVHSERFAVDGAAQSPRPVREAGEVAGQCRVTVVMDGNERQFTMRADQNVLEAGRANGLELPYSCLGGVCSTCRARVVRGAFQMPVNYALEPWELEAGYALACQCYPTGEEIVLDYDQV